MPGVEILRIRNAIQYTGANGAEVSTFAGTSIVSDTGTVLQLGDPPSGWVSVTMHVGDWYELSEGTAWTNTDFTARYVTKAAALQDNDTVFNPAGLQSQITANANAITALNTSQGTQDTAIAAAASAAAGKLGKVDLVSISVPILLLGATADRVITWNRAFSNTSYDLSYAYDASTIGRITCAPVAGTKTTTGITIRISASLLAVSVLGVVHVLGIGA